MDILHSLRQIRSVDVIVLGINHYYSPILLNLFSVCCIVSLIRCQCTTGLIICTLFIFSSKAVAPPTHAQFTGSQFANGPLLRTAFWLRRLRGKWYGEQVNLEISNNWMITKPTSRVAFWLLLRPFQKSIGQQAPKKEREIKLDVGKMIESRAYSNTRQCRQDFNL